jgi:hypothetical protein
MCTRDWQRHATAFQDETQPIPGLSYEVTLEADGSMLRRFVGSRGEPAMPSADAGRDFMLYGGHRPRERAPHPVVAQTVMRMARVEQ